MINSNYTSDDHLTWKVLIANRKSNLEHEACDIYLTGLSNLKLPETRVPSCQEVNDLMSEFSDWRMVPTAELITSSRYYNMLANCKFPAITDIRPSQEIEYYVNEKPDVIHEYFGHGPFLIHTEYSDFMRNLAKLALQFSLKEQALLGRLFWFTIEFGLVQTKDGLRIYGAGIIPSRDESHYALYDSRADRREFNLVDILRTPIIATQKQNIYYVIESLESLYSLNKADLLNALLKSARLGSMSC